MTIYLDYIFIENFLIDYILLKETSYVARKKITHKRTIISSIIASIYVVAMTYLKIQELNYVICKILLVFIMTYISFKPRQLNEYAKIIALFLLISVINVGTITVITNILSLQNITGALKVVIYASSFACSKLFMKHMWKIYNQEIKNNNLIYEVNISLGNKTYTYKAFLDTGNNVFSYTYNLPVVFAELLDDTILEELVTKDSFDIRTVTLSNEQNKKAYILDKIQIKQKDKIWYVKAAVVFEKMKLSKDNSYNMLLNYNLYTQSLGGIKI